MKKALAEELECEKSVWKGKNFFFFSLAARRRKVGEKRMWNIEQSVLSPPAPAEKDGKKPSLNFLNFFSL